MSQSIHRCRWTALILTLAWTAISGSVLNSFADDSGTNVVVIFNTEFEGSKVVAEHYAARRSVPDDQVLGLRLPQSETLTRREFEENLEAPLRRYLENRAEKQVEADVERPEGKFSDGPSLKPPIRYAVLCYGVPLRILEDASREEEGSETLPVEIRRTEAAVESDLATLFWPEQNRKRYGAQPNPFYGATNGAVFSAESTNRVLLVARLDGPSQAVAQKLVDQAIEAEKRGLWGRAYFDARGLTNGNYEIGDRWIRGAAYIARRMGFETVLDEQSETFSSGYPLSHVALYAGWYDGHVSGPFARQTVEFVPGAIAYHLHSFSARSIRSTDRFWVGPLLDRGAAATLGCVAEPYLEGTPDLAVLFTRFLAFGFSWGEAAYASQNVLSWQTAVVGDPLYRPFGVHPRDLHMRLEATRDPWVDWSHLRMVNLNQVTDLPVPELIDYLESRPELKESAILQEKLGDLYLLSDQPARAAQAYADALQSNPSAQQQIRLELARADVLREALDEENALAQYRSFLAQHPEYPGKREVYEAMLPLVEKLQDAGEADELRRKMAQLGGTASSEAESGLP